MGYRMKEEHGAPQLTDKLLRHEIGKLAKVYTNAMPVDMLEEIRNSKGNYTRAYLFSLLLMFIETGMMNEIIILQERG